VVASRRARFGFTALLTAALVAACSSSGTEVVSTTAGPGSTTAPRPAPDGQLVIGILLPGDGPGALVADGIRTGIDLAVAEINDTGGVLGRPLALRWREEGTDATTASLAVNDLVGQGVDAVVGPVSSRSAGLVTDRVVASGVAQCLPVSADRDPSGVSGRGLVTHAMPSVALTGTALGQVLVETGRRRVTVIAPSDDYGRLVADAALATVRAQGIDAARVLYDPRSPNAAEVASRATLTEPDAVALVGNPVPGADVLGALLGNGLRPPTVPIALSEGFRQADLTVLAADGRTEALEGILTVAPRGEPEADWFRERLDTDARGRLRSYSGYGFDCVTLIALAAAISLSDDPTVFGPRLVDVSRGGIACRGYAACLPLLADGRNIDLVGASGPFDLDDAGNPTTGTFELTRWNRDGQERPVRVVTVR
jgi:branched-chain amino acid transport system substrate-binding protein